MKFFVICSLIRHLVFSHQTEDSIAYPTNSFIFSTLLCLLHFRCSLPKSDDPLSKSVKHKTLEITCDRGTLHAMGLRSRSFLWGHSGISGKVRVGKAASVLKPTWALGSRSLTVRKQNILQFPSYQIHFLPCLSQWSVPLNPESLWGFSRNWCTWDGVVPGKTGLQGSNWSPTKNTPHLAPPCHSTLPSSCPSLRLRGESACFYLCLLRGT